MPQDDATPGGPWPTPHQELLLRAALGETRVAGEALAQWEAGFDPASLDHASWTLLPLVARRVDTLALSTPRAADYTAAYRRAWYRNQLLFRAVRRAMTRLHAAGIRTLLLKGAALTQTAFDDVGVRPMADCDVLVPSDRAEQAAQVLREAGFVSEYPLDPELVRRRHSIACRNADGYELDLHWHVLPEEIAPYADEAFWAASVPLAWGDVQTRTLCPADHFLLVASHALRGGRKGNPIYWIADAMALLRLPGQAMDWARLLDRAHRSRLTLVVRRALEYLIDRFDAPVPAEVVSALAAAPVSRAERIEYWLKLRNVSHSPVGMLPQYWFTYSRLCDRLSQPRTPGSFLRFVRERHPVGVGTMAWRALALPFQQLAWMTGLARPPRE